MLDGDNVRCSLSLKLGFSEDDRRENIRRISEAAKLMMEAGVIAMTALISPFLADREAVRKLMPHGDFFEIYCKASLESCESRDVKGLHKKARAGEIKNYAGIDSPYEALEKPKLVIDTDTLNIVQSARAVLNLLQGRGMLPGLTP